VLHEGPVLLRHDGGDANCSGALVLRWLPSTGLRLEVDILSGQSPRSGDTVKAEFEGAKADMLIKSTSISFAEGVVSNKIVAIVSSIDMGSPDNLGSIGFQVVNFLNFRTPGPRLDPSFGCSSMMADLQCSGWRAGLTVVRDSKALFESLDATGGYAFTHLGRLERVDGSAFSAQEAEPLLRALAGFLSFARGAACSLPIQWGTGVNGEIAWRRWGSPIVDPWRQGYNWFDEQHGNVLSELFPAFVQTYGDCSVGEPFKLALHWYQKCNTRAGGMEGAIILGLTALDLLGALVVVDQVGAMTASKYDRLPAAMKLAELLKVLKVPMVFPNRVRDLQLFADRNGWSDPAVALAEIRHGYVHANQKRRGMVLAAPSLATFWAWQLSLWYQELALLRLLKHSGDYHNRLTAEWVGQVEQVPWA
jgi:hypothetical protein